jgi:hypothetical protein
MAGEAGSPQLAQSQAELALHYTRKARKPIMAYSAELARHAA